MKTGITPSASGSAYLEVAGSTLDGCSGLKLTCTVHGPRSLPKSAPFTPYAALSAHVKYAPFATRQRRSYLKDSGEKDLGIHLEAALRGVIIADRWPKSSVEVVVTVLEADQPRDLSRGTADETFDSMNVLSGCITVASAAIAHAGIDCVDMVAGGVAALVVEGNSGEKPITRFVLDPVASEHVQILAGCCVAYLPIRDEVTNVWLKGQIPAESPELHEELVEKAIQASRGANKVLVECLKETTSQVAEGHTVSIDIDT